jgi:hypothetical protein
MKKLIAAVALIALSSPALANSRGQVPANEAYAQSRQAPVYSFAQQRHPNWSSNLNLQSRTTDPDPFIRDYLRNDQPGNQWR